MLKTILSLAGVALALMVVLTPAQAEYGDIVLNRLSEENGERPVVFPHWFHRIRYQCKVCHGELEFEMRAGKTEATMDDITDGKFCGKCHNDKIAWGTDRCELCHSGLPGLKTKAIGGDKTLGPGIY